VHDFYAQPDNRRMMSTYTHAARCYRARDDVTFTVFGVALTPVTSTMRRWARVRVRNIRTGALDQMYTAYINNGHIGSNVNCDEMSSDEDEATSITKEDTTPMATASNEEILISLDMTRESSDDEDENGAETTGFDDEAYTELTTKPVSGTNASARWQEDEFEAPALDQVYIVDVFYVDLGIDYIGLPLALVCEIRNEHCTQPPYAQQMSIASSSEQTLTATQLQDFHQRLSRCPYASVHVCAVVHDSDNVDTMLSTVTDFKFEQSSSFCD